MNVVGGVDLTLASFDGKAQHTFKELNDPVMGGESTGTWSVNASGYGVFDGQVVDVPSLKAPGFIKVRYPCFTRPCRSSRFRDTLNLHNFSPLCSLLCKAATYGSFPDVSSTFGGAIRIQVRSSTPEYEGFRLAFASGTIAPSYSCAGGGSIPLSRGCFKAHFTVPAGENFIDVVIPFTNFSDMWSPATGVI